MPVILATQEAEIRRIVVQSQPGQIVYETQSQKYQQQKGLVEWPEFKPQYHKKKRDSTKGSEPHILSESLGRGLSTNTSSYIV
jgi:hypothetical protein